MFGAIKLAKNADPNKYGYNDYGIGFYAHSDFSFPTDDFGENVFIFDLDNSPSTHTHGRKKEYINYW